MRLTFPHSDLRNIRVFYFLSFFQNCWFFLANWMFLYAKYLTKTQIGFVDGIAVLLGIAFEIPTGLISDVFGKKTTLILGNGTMAFGYLFLAFSTNLESFLIGTIILFLGYAFNSGSFDAFAYDSLVEKQKQQDYDQVVARSTSLGIIASFFAIFAGGVLFALDARLPLIGSAMCNSIAMILLFFSTEPKIDTQKVTLQSSLNKLRDGVATIFSLRFRDILIPVVVIVSLAKTLQGVIRQSTAIYFSFNGETYSYVLAFTMIPVYLISRRFDKISRRLGTIPLMIFLLTVYTGLFVFGSLMAGAIAGAIYFTIQMIAEKLSQQTMSVSANERIDSGHRATALSALSLITQLPYVVLMFFFASWTEPDKMRWLIVGFGGVAAITCIYTFFMRPRKAILETLNTQRI